MANLISALFMAVALSACGLTTPAPVLNPNSHNLKFVAGVQGKFMSVDDSTVDFSSNAPKSRVVMFVSETCAVCRRETKALVADRAARGAPKNVEFFSVLIGSILSDAADWQTGLSVNWQVGIDPGDNLFRQYCPEGQTPCMFLYNPSTGLTAKFIGEHSLNEWEQVTGKWIF